MKRYLTLLSLCFAAVQMVAQENSKIKGIVQDEKGKPVSGASVHITSDSDTSISFSTTTNSNGIFEVSGLLSDEKYDIEIDHLHHESYYIDNYKVNAGDNNSLSVKLNQSIGLEAAVVTALGIKR